MIYDREMASPPTGTDKPVAISSHKTSSSGSYLGLCVPLKYDVMYKVRYVFVGVVRACMFMGVHTSIACGGVTIIHSIV